MLRNEDVGTVRVSLSELNLAAAFQEAEREARAWATGYCRSIRGNPRVVRTEIKLADITMLSLESGITFEYAFTAEYELSPGSADGHESPGSEAKAPSP